MAVAGGRAQRLDEVWQLRRQPLGNDAAWQRAPQVNKRLSKTMFHNHKTENFFNSYPNCQFSNRRYDIHPNLHIINTNHCFF